MGRRDTAKILIPADVDEVYAALTDPQALAKWLPPSGMSGRFEHYDLRSGGSFRMVLTYNDASRAEGKSSETSDVVDGRFVEVVPGKRIVQAIEFESEDPAFAGKMTMIWSVSKANGGTRVEIVAENVPPGISAEDHAEGMNSSLANLANWLERAS
jgi:uncharacterized protein YndB with AHSA1/START domain